MQELGSSYPQGDAKVAAGGEADLLVCVCVGGGGVKWQAVAYQA